MAWYWSHREDNALQLKALDATTATVCDAFHAEIVPIYNWHAVPAEAKGKSVYSTI